MNLYQTHESLCHIIRTAGLQLRENRQVTKRLKELFPVRLAQLKQTLRHGRRASAAERVALNHPTYHQYIEEYLDIYSSQLKNQIQLESHRMLLQARQSLRSFYNF